MLRVARIAVERGQGSVTLHLGQWSLKQSATLTDDEARQLVRMIERSLESHIERDDSDLA